MTVRLTPSIAAQATYQGKGNNCYVVWDGELSGFGLRVYPSGQKRWVLQYNASGMRRLHVLGRYPVLTVTKARKKAVSALAEIGDGGDPARSKTERKRATTVAELCDRYLSEHAPLKKSRDADVRRIKHYVRPELGQLKVDEVQRNDVLGLYRRIGSTKPYEANRVLALLSVMFNLARDWGALPDDAPNPARIPARSRYLEKRRDRPVTSNELPRLLETIHAETDVYVRTAFLLLLATGLRKREVLHAQWHNVDLERATLRLADTKTRQPRHVPLSSHAVELIRALPQAVGNPYLFPSPVKVGIPRYDLFKAWSRIRDDAGCSDLRIHDLRHTVATLLAEQGHAAQIVQSALGHQSLATTMRYIHTADAGPRRALTALGDALIGVAKTQHASG